MRQMNTDKDCIFCKIIVGELSSDIVYRDDEVIVFRDIHPLAPVHLLIIPRKHIPSIRDLTEDDLPLLGHMTVVANHLADSEGLAGKTGWRTACYRIPPLYDDLYDCYSPPAGVFHSMDLAA